MALSLSLHEQRLHIFFQLINVETIKHKEYFMANIISIYKYSKNLREKNLHFRKLALRGSYIYGN